MNTSEIAKHILEGDHDEFDPIDYVKSAKNRESAVEIYNGPLVRVIQPLATFTINNYLPDQAAWDDGYFKSIEQDGPIYLVVDKADHDNMAIFQPSSNNAWNAEGKQVDFKELPNLIQSGDDKNWLDLQQGLATFFMAQIAKKKNVGQWVKFLTMIGRTDLATNYARYLGRAKLPFGKSIDAVLAMKKAGKRSRNRIARLMKNQDDVKWGERGFWLLFNDWGDLAPFYGKSHNHDYAKNAEKIFNGNTYDWFENAENRPEEVWDTISDANMSVIKQLLVNRTVYNSDGEEHVATSEFVDELVNDEIKDIVCDRGNKGDAAKDIYRAIAWAANDAYTSTMESAYYDGYRHALEQEWGLKEDSTIKWIGIGKREPDKKLGGGMVQQGDQKTMLGLYFPYSTLEDWIKQWKEDEYEDDFYGDIHELAKAYLPKVEPDDEYYGDSMDSEYFNEQVAHQLSEIKPTAPQKVEDPNQPELPLQGEPDPRGREVERPVKVSVGSNLSDQTVHKNIPQSDASKYSKAMGWKVGGKDIYLQAETLLAHPFSRLENDNVDPKTFAAKINPVGFVLLSDQGGYYDQMYRGWGSSPDRSKWFHSEDEARRIMALHNLQDHEVHPVYDDPFPAGESAPMAEANGSEKVTACAVRDKKTGKMGVDCTHSYAMEVLLSQYGEDYGGIHSLDDLNAKSQAFQNQVWKRVEIGFLTDQKRFIDRDEASRLTGIKDLHGEDIPREIGEARGRKGPPAPAPGDQPDPKSFVMGRKEIFLPARNEVEYDLDPVEEHMDFHGHFDSGEPELDRQNEEWIERQLEIGNQWAWCSVRVRATWTDPVLEETFHGYDYLGGCSYKSEKDFCHPDGYYPQMKEEAYEDLIKNVEKRRAALGEAVDPKAFAAHVPHVEHFLVRGMFLHSQYPSTNFFYKEPSQWTPHAWDAEQYASYEQAESMVSKLSQNHNGPGTLIQVVPKTAGDAAEYESLTEAQLLEAVYKRSTTQIDIPKEIGGHIIQWGELNIADEDLYIDEKDGCGRETEQHVTVLYGLTDGTPPEALTEIVSHTKPFLIEFGGISVFENEKYDVIKLDVISEELHNLHMEIRGSCQNDNKYPEYIPHCTVAYVKPGLGKKYAGQDVFKTAKVARDFWAYDLLFKGAGDSEDGERVVQLIPFDKSKDFERDEPEAGEQRYPEATKEEPELAVAESMDPKQRKWVGMTKQSDELAKTDPQAATVMAAGGTLIRPALPSREKWKAMLAAYAPGCGSPTPYPGTASKVPCGSTVEGKQFLCPYCAVPEVSESDEVDPKGFSQKIKPFKTWSFKVRPVEGGRMFQVFYLDQPAGEMHMGRRGVPYIHRYRDFLVNQIAEKEQSSPFDPARFKTVWDWLDTVNESDEVDPKKFTERPGTNIDPHPDWQLIDREQDKNGRIKALYRHKHGRVFFKVTNDLFGDDAATTPLNSWWVNVYAGEDLLDGEDFQAESFAEAEATATNIAFTLIHSTAPALLQPRRTRPGQQQQESDAPDPKALALRTESPIRALILKADSFPERTEDRRRLIGFQLATQEGEFPEDYPSFAVMTRQYLMDTLNGHPDLAVKFDVFPIYDGDVEEPTILESEEINAKEFLDRATRYRVRLGVGAMTRYISKDPGTGQMFWRDFDEATVFTADEAEAIISDMGETYGGQPVQGELADDHHPDSHFGESDAKSFASRLPMFIVQVSMPTEHDYKNPPYYIKREGESHGGYFTQNRQEAKTFYSVAEATEAIEGAGQFPHGHIPEVVQLTLGESDEIDPKALSSRVVSNRYVLRSKLDKHPKYIVASDGQSRRLGSSEFDNIRLTRDIKKATTFSFSDAQRWCEVYIHFEPVQVEDGASSAYPVPMGESAGPFDDDGLPGEVSTFLRKVRSRRPRKKAAGQQVI